jgi:hypothetical protein
MSLVESKISEAVFKPTVGEEFINWAEKYWGLKNKYEQESTNSSDESMPYEYVKEVFSRKIDEIIKERMSF